MSWLVGLGGGLLRRCFRPLKGLPRMAIKPRRRMLKARHLRFLEIRCGLTQTSYLHRKIASRLLSHQESIKEMHVSLTYYKLHG